MTLTFCTFNMWNNCEVAGQQLMSLLVFITRLATLQFYISYNIFNIVPTEKLFFLNNLFNFNRNINYKNAEKKYDK